MNGVDQEFDDPPAYQAGDFAAPATRIADLPGPPRLLLLGNSPQLMRTGSLHILLEQWASQYGPIYQIGIGPQAAIVLSDASMAGLLLRARPGEFGRSEHGIRVLKSVGLGGLFAAEGSQWAIQRSLMSQVLGAQSDASLAGQIGIYTDRLVERWVHAARTGATIDGLADLKRYAIDLTTRLCIGEDLNLLQGEASDFQQDIELLFSSIESRIASPVAYWDYFRLPKDRRIDDARTRVQAWIHRLVVQARDKMRAAPGQLQPSNLLEAFVAASDNSDAATDEFDIQGNIASLLFAGEDTTANTLAWLLYLLASHPSHLDAVSSQLLTIRKQSSADHWYRNVPLLWACIKETLRLKPIAPVLAIAPRRPVSLGGLLVPTGTRILLLLRQGLLDSDEGGQYTTFSPERWLGEHAAARDQLASLDQGFPFGGGARQCPGEQLAMDQISAAAAAILCRLKIALAVAPESINEKLNMTMGPDRLPLHISER